MTDRNKARIEDELQWMFPPLGDTNSVLGFAQAFYKEGKNVPWVNI